VELGQKGYKGTLRKGKTLIILPSTEEKTTKSGKKEPGLKPRMQKVNRFKMILDVDRNILVN
jgi:hypothetical protein